MVAQGTFRLSGSQTAPVPEPAPLISVAIALTILRLRKRATRLARCTPI
ncbi:MAG: hypothetical protein DMF84_24065 [Acidobacteria bacterium]|nr:MAG: hypothetical protein DMF84_24065 [Acidobacteriota bacterium]